MKDKHYFSSLRQSLEKYGIYYSKGDLHRWGDSKSYFGCTNYHSLKDLESATAWAEGYLQAIDHNFKK